MALTWRHASAQPAPGRPERLRRTVTSPVPVLLSAAVLSGGFLVLVSNLVARLG